MNEIEEIKKSISQRGKGDIFVGFEETLLSSLEKEKEQSNYFRLETNRLTDELAKEKERVRILKQTMTCDPDHWDAAYVNWATKDVESRLKELEEATRQAQEENPNEVHCTCVPLLKVRIKELEAVLASIKADKSIGKLEIVDRVGEDD